MVNPNLNPNPNPNPAKACTRKAQIAWFMLLGNVRKIEAR